MYNPNRLTQTTKNLRASLPKNGMRNVSPDKFNHDLFPMDDYDPKSNPNKFHRRAGSGAPGTKKLNSQTITMTGQSTPHRMQWSELPIKGSRKSSKPSETDGRWVQNQIKEEI